jgi:CheY-like chemotaxis protein
MGIKEQHELTETAVSRAAPDCKLSASVLLAEDNVVNQKVASLMLQRLGCEVHIVGNGREAIAACTARVFDLIFMDVQMPYMDGLEAARCIRKLQGKDTPIIALTASAVSGDREKCLEAGMDDYLAKPVTSQVLADKLPRWLAQE